MPRRPGSRRPRSSSGTEAVLHRADAAPAGIELVAFLEFDQELLAARYRAAEQALWLLVRAARVVGGRRGDGRVLVQTRVPEHDVMEAALAADPTIVDDAGHARRRVLGFPPFGGLAELSGAPDAVDAACVVLRAVDHGPRVGSDRTSGRRPGRWCRRNPPTRCCDALVEADLASARAHGRLRIDVDPLRV